MTIDEQAREQAETDAARKAGAWFHSEESAIERKCFPNMDAALMVGYKWGHVAGARRSLSDAELEKAESVLVNVLDRFVRFQCSKRDAVKMIARALGHEEINAT